MAQRKFLIVSVILFFLGSGLIWLGFQTSDKIPPRVSEPTPSNISSDVQISPQISPEEGILVNRVVDGDTIEIEGGQKVRYIGIDTPETVDPRRDVGCYGKEASDENKKIVEGKRVILTKDVSETDKYDRLLRFVYLKQANGKLLFVNDYLVRQGYAKASSYPPDVKFSEQFVMAEREAREAKRGLWQKCL